MNIAASWTSFCSHLDEAHRLGLNLPNTGKFAIAYYLPRVPILRGLAPPHFTVKLRGDGNRSALLRPNGVDPAILTDVFARELYDVPAASNVRRILDLGANIGLATLFFATRFPNAEFACVEPSPANAAILREQIAVNRIRATVIEAAIGTAPGKAELYVGSDPTTYSLTPNDELGLRQVTVPQFTVDQVFEKLGWASADLLKIDIEGYEKPLFHTNTEWLRRVRRIVGEAHGHVQYGIDEVRTDLEPLGFKVAVASYDSRYRLTIFQAERM